MFEIIFLCVLLILCFLLSSFFSGAEMAYFSANKIRLENLKENKDKKAERALYIIEHFEDSLSAILIGNNLVNIAASSIGSVIGILLIGNSNYAWVSTVVITLIVIVFCETIPKIASARRATTRALAYSLPVQIITVLLKPVVLVVVFLVKIMLFPFKGKEETHDNADESVEELQSIIETAEDEGVLDESDTQIISNAIDFAEISAYEAMTARVDVQAIDIDDDFEQILSFIEKTPYSRIPVYRNSIDNVVGVLHQNLFLQTLIDNKDGFDLKNILKSPCYVYKTMKLPTVLNELKKTKQHLAIVTDEYSGTLGIITMEDVLEKIVGKIWDETDEVENDVVVKNDREFEIDGDLHITEFIELVNLDQDEFEAESETVGGWVVEMLEKFPQKGDSFVFRNLKITVLSVIGRRVEKLLIEQQ